MFIQQVYFSLTVNKLLTLSDRVANSILRQLASTLAADLVLELLILLELEDHLLLVELLDGT